MSVYIQLEKFRSQIQSIDWAIGRCLDSRNGVAAVEEMIGAFDHSLELPDAATRLVSLAQVHSQAGRSLWFEIAYAIGRAADLVEKRLVAGFRQLALTVDAGDELSNAWAELMQLYNEADYEAQKAAAEFGTPTASGAKSGLSCRTARKPIPAAFLDRYAREAADALLGR